VIAAACYLELLLAVARRGAARRCRRRPSEASSGVVARSRAPPLVGFAAASFVAVRHRC
ncbi:hypothetical protein Dimus_010241, partial [Dionaea muscipula]